MDWNGIDLGKLVGGSWNAVWMANVRRVVSSSMLVGEVADDADDANEFEEHCYRSVSVPECAVNVNMGV